MKFPLRNNSGQALVLYHAISSYQLLEVILHRMMFHRTERAVLLLPDFITAKYPQYQKLVSRRFFHEVYLFPYLKIPHREEGEILGDVIQYWEQVVPHNIREFSHIYVAGAHFYFSLYLLHKRIPFFFFEDAAGMLSRWKELYAALCVNYPVHARIALKHGLFNGENPMVRQIICLEKAQNTSEGEGKRQNFSVEEALEGVGKRDRKQILRFFLKHKYHLRADGILLTQHFANLGIMTKKKQMELYQRLREQLPQDIRLIVKRHPDDTLDYNGIFPKAKIIKEAFPAELLPYVFFHKPGIIYTFDSSGCENLTKHFEIKKIERENYAG